MLSLGGSAIALFTRGNEFEYIVSFLILAFFMCIRALSIHTRNYVKGYLILSYIMIAIAQISLCHQILTGIPEYQVYLNKIICLLMLPTSFLLEKSMTTKKYVGFKLPSREEMHVVSFGDIKERGYKIYNRMGELKKTKDSLSAENIAELLSDLPRHSSFKYINNGSLTQEYFKKAYGSRDDENIYLVISNTGSAASEVISVFTNKTFNHISIAFDAELETIVSYNGGERVYPPGLNLEMVELFHKKEDSSILVYSLKATPQQKETIIDHIYEINQEGSAYNYLGLLIGQAFKPNIMFCSQFVYTMLDQAGLGYFQKESMKVKPTDFVEMDYYRNLQYEYEIIGKEQRQRQQLELKEYAYHN